MILRVLEVLEILDVDGPLRRDGQTSGELFRPYVEVVWDEGEARGNRPAEDMTPDYPRQLVQERVTGASA